MPETLSRCPLCKDYRSTRFDRRDFRGYQVVNRLCKNCGLVYQSPRMTESELDVFYQKEYRQIYQGREEPDQKNLVVQKARAQAVADLLKDSGVETVDRYADIGSSTGLLLEKVKSEFKCRAIGIEPGEAFRLYAQDRGLEVFDSLEAVKAAGEPEFDLISMIHVLEHIAAPVSYLTQLRKNFLTPDGKLFIEVPNLYAHDCFEVAHLTSFSRHSLVQVVKMAGFTTIFLQPHGQPRSKMIPLYISLLAVPDNNNLGQNLVEEEKWIRFKRRSGMAHRRVIERIFPHQAWLPEYRG